MQRSGIQSFLDFFPPEPVSARVPIARRLIAPLRRRSRVIAICAASSFTIGLAYLVFTPSIYQTRATIHVEPADVSLPGREATAGSLLAEQPQVIRSSPVVALAIAASHPRTSSLLQGKSDAIDFIQSNLSVSTAGSTGDYEIALTSSKPADAETFLEGLVSAYRSFASSPRPINADQASALRSQKQKIDDQIAEAGSKIDALLMQHKEGMPSVAPAGAHDSDTLDDQTASLRAEIDRLTATSDELGQRLARRELSPDNSVVITLLKSPFTAADKVSPKLMSVLGFATLCGALLGMIVAFVLDQTSPDLQDAEDAQSEAQMPVLGRVPTMSEDLSSPTLRGQCVLVKPADPAAGAWRDVRSTLETLLVPGIDKTVLVTGPGTGHGKSVLASNLAIAMARSGQRVALVDAHHHRPAIHRIFGIEDRVGLHNAIEGTLQLDDALHVTALGGLEILPTGFSETDWTRLLSRPEFLNVLAELSERFDRVIIDGGPASLDETRVISAFCDATILTVSPGHCLRSELRSAAQGLRAVGARLVGIVLNDLPMHRVGAKKSVSFSARLRGAPLVRSRLAEPA